MYWKFFNCAKERLSSGECEYSELCDRINEGSTEELFAQGARYHRHCYKNLTNMANIRAAKDRYERGKMSGNVAVIASPKLGRRPVSTLGESSCSSTIYRDVVTRKSKNPKNEMLCVFLPER